MRDRFLQWAEPRLGELLGSIAFPDQPVLSAIGGLIATAIAVHWAHRSGLVWWKTLLASGGAALVGAAVARVFWIFTVWDQFLARPFLLIDPFRGGQTSFGALTGAALGAALTLWLLKAPVRRHADVLAPAGLVGIAWARVGCLMRSCDFGQPSELPWAIRYPVQSPVYRAHLNDGLIEVGDKLSAPVHPFPLYLGAWCLVCFAVARAFPSIFGVKPGQRAVGAGLLYLAGRFVWEFWRQPGNAPTIWGPLNAGHLFAVGSFVTLGVIFVAVSRMAEGPAGQGAQR